MLEKMQEKLKYLSIRKKIIFYIYLVVSPMMVAIISIGFINNYKSIKSKQIEADVNLNDSLSKNINMIQNELSDLSLYICINQEVKKILTSSDVQMINRDSRLWYNNAPMRIVEDIVALKGYIKTIAIYPENGVRTYLNDIDSTVQFQTIEEVRKTPGYQKAIHQAGNVVWLRTESGDSRVYKSNYNAKIVMCREILDLSKKKQLGYLVIGMDVDKYIDICKVAIQRENEGVIVLSDEGQELVRYGEVSDEILDYLKNQREMLKERKYQNSYFLYHNYRVFYNQGSDNGSPIVCKIVPISNYNEELYYMFSTQFLVLIGLLVAMCLLLKEISNIIIKPLSDLSIAMKAFEKGDFKQQLEINCYDEIGEVTKCFNQMVRSIKTLIQNNYVMALKEKESELTALQAQINPHFLYNTLDSLYWRALNGGDEVLAEDILALAELFRMVLGKGKSIVTVREEKELISRYLQIQKMRFAKRLSYEIKIEDALLEEYIPKLILQPFVENAIMHGIENLDTEGYLSITGEVQDRYLVFTIEDNGIGMSEDQIDMLWKAEDAEKYSRQRVGRYAIKNVKERLVLKYQDDFKLTIESKLGEGTKVTIVIPSAVRERESYANQTINCR